ncbi:unnamed protein product [Arctia plantaginis]|uniref:Uncharacterized protein n=1 Tax=Arctia plantaginis TaxID=874455 RepID=A0A8S1AHG4_ARCPL|nr:unnamed protein product [Arctia plantaginis]CAB3260588.1 unnamed protein product [Arctia plantaginis]
MVTYAFSCERFTFEEGFDDLFSSELGFCSIIHEIAHKWAIGTFESINIKSFNERSTQFIYPNEQISCVSSPYYDMIPGGTIEVNVFMANHLSFDLIQVTVLDEHNADAGTRTKWGYEFAEGWGTIQITILGRSPFRGLFSILGMASAHSTVLVDSIRYLPPGISESDCLLYETDDDDSNNVTTDGIIIDTTDVTIDKTTNYTTDVTIDKTTNYTTDVTIDKTTNYILYTDNMTDNNTHDITDVTTTGDANSSTDDTTLAVTDDASDDTTDNISNDSTDVIPTESTIRESGEDISTSPTPICDHGKDGLFARLKMAILVAVNVSGEVVAPNPACQCQNNLP